MATPELDTLLLELRRNDAMLVAAEAARELALSSVEEDHRGTLEPLRARREQLLEQVFQAARRLPVGVSETHTHGELQHRTLPPHVELDRPDDEMVAQLTAAGLFGAIVETRTVSRQALAGMSKELLERAGVRLVARRQLVIKLPTGTRFARELS